MNSEGHNLKTKSSSLEKAESVKSEKQVAWENALIKVNEITDRLGKEVDEKIRESVAAFLIHEFTPVGSCEGHLNEEGGKRHGLSHPWIDVRAPEPEEWQKAQDDKKEQLKQELRIKNFKQQRKLMVLLEEFYQKRETPFDARLIFDRSGGLGNFRVQSFGANMTAVLTPEEQKLTLYQKEMKDFTEFLKDKYLSTE